MFSIVSRTLKNFFNLSQIKALMDAATAKEHGKPVFEAGKEWRGLILYSYYVGSRLQDGANVRWDQSIFRGS